MKCFNCGKEISETAKFCGYCGSTVRKIQEESEPVKKEGFDASSRKLGGGENMNPAPKIETVEPFIPEEVEFKEEIVSNPIIEKQIAEPVAIKESVSREKPELKILRAENVVIYMEDEENPFDDEKTKKLIEFFDVAKVEFAKGRGIAWSEKGQISLSAYAKKDNEALKKAVTSLINKLLEVKTNNPSLFVDADLDPENIMIDEKTEEAFIIILPLKYPVYSSVEEFREDFSLKYLKLLKESGFEENEAEDFLADCPEGIYSKEYVESLKKDCEKEAEATEIIAPSSIAVKMTGTNTSEETIITIIDFPFVVGKSVQLADGVISCSKAVSRKHCQFIKEDGVIMVKDLESTNGTILNGEKLEPGKGYSVRDGDRLRLSDQEFLVELISWR